LIRRLWIIAAALSLAFAAGTRDQFDAWVTRTQLPSLSPDVSVEVQDRSGFLLHGFTVADGLWRFETSHRDVDPVFLEMLVRYEDKRFYRHSGVDVWAALQAAAQAAINGEVLSGASTLTMQVARLLEDGPTGSLKGKLRQVRVALAIERILSKDQILSLYLTLAPYGGNLESTRAASLRYFGKPPSRLTAPQAALLIAIPQSPARRRPDRFPEAANLAALRVLSRLEMPVKQVSDIAGRYDFPQLGAHASLNITREDSSRTVYRLTLDKHIQKQFEALALSSVRTLDRKTSIAMIAMDHTTGQIVASVGSAKYQASDRDGYVDMTQALRSPGSTLKPIIYAMGFDEGLAHPETVFDDRPIDFGSYSPQNFDGVFRGDIRLRKALQQSLNTPVVALTQKLGPARVMSKLDQAGATAVVNGGKAGLAIALGGVGISLKDLVVTYASLANRGYSVEPLLHMNAGPKVTPKQIVSEKAAWYVTDILRGVAPPANASRNAIAFKTGTSYGHRDAWAIGYDGRHVVGVWLGRPDGTPIPGAFGGNTAAPVLFQAFSRLKPRFDPFQPPPSAALLVSSSELPKANGAPIKNGSHRRSMDVERLSRGFHEFTVIDASGNSAKTRIEFR